MGLDLQKASMWKRISAFLFDFILLGIVSVLVAWGLSALVGYDGYSRIVADSYEKYGAEYGVNLKMTYSEYEALTEEEARRVDEAFAALNADAKALRANQMMLQLSVLIVSLSLFLSHLTMEFLIPLKIGDGQTLGKKIFGIGLMKQDHVKVGAVQLFIRAILGKYTIETMIPVLILMMVFWGTIGVVGPAVIGLILLVEVLVLIFTPTNALIHDLLAGTVAVDQASQRIFDTADALIAYKKERHAEDAARREY
ncbi:MAG: RDD family protein [Clostridia bacterium]|nr:RDD family protein [Clostridia bacterium]